MTNLDHNPAQFFTDAVNLGTAEMKADLQSQGYSMVQYGKDENLVVNFYWNSVLNVAESERHGRPYYDRKVFVQINQPGERLNIIDRPAKTDDARRFPRQWFMFQQNRAQVPEGTPIALLFPAEPNIADMLRGWGVHTIEQCARLSGHAVQEIGMGAQDYTNKANDYLRKAKEGVDYHKIKQLEEKYDRDLASRDREIADLKRLIDGLQQEFRERLPQFATAGMGSLMAQAAAAPETRPPAKPFQEVTPTSWANAPEGFFEDKPDPAPAKQEAAGKAKGKG